jgi:Ca2+-binding RTX toxin-like protein
MALPTQPTRLTSTADVWTGTLQDEWIIAGAGNDTLEGRDGNDRLDGGDGDDRILGDQGNDTLYGGAGNDAIDGGVGDDRINGGDGDDILSGGEGNDRILGGGGRDIIDGGAGDDRITAAPTDPFSGAVTDFEIRGGSGFDTLYLEASTRTGFQSVQNVERFIGSEESDSLDFTVYQANGTPSLGDDATQSAGVTADGRGGNDQLTGTAIADRLYGGDGDDYLSGGAGNDTLSGGNGIDFMNGGDGKDLFRGVGTSDFVFGGEGYDTVMVSDGPISILGDFMRGVERITAGAGDHFLDFEGSTADPSNLSRGIRVDSGDGRDIIRGSARTDVLNGGAGDDRVNGGAGDDVIIASTGRDSLAGGAGRDTFDLRTMSAGYGSQVIIEDFTRGEDIVSLRGLGVTFADLDIFQGQIGSVTSTAATLNIGTPDAKYIIFVGMTAAEVNAEMFLV